MGYDSVMPSEIIMHPSGHDLAQSFFRNKLRSSSILSGFIEVCSPLAHARQGLE